MPELEAGQRIGTFRLLFQLGKGGMGEVWAAFGSTARTTSANKVVALKLMPVPSGGEASNTVVMFYDEAKAAAALVHPAIVRTFELGRDGDLAYISMELVRGPSLNTLLTALAETRQPLTPAQIAYVGERIASALDYAHREATFEGQRLQLIHRDVSPQNVLFETNGELKLGDFGIARTAIQDHLTRTGTMRGKPSYMSPEQVLARPLDARCDIFALGIVLYECAVLRRLFGRKEAAKAMDAVLNFKQTPACVLSPGFPVDLSLIIDKMLEKNRERRYASAAEVRSTLAELGRTLPGWDEAPAQIAEVIAERFGRDAFDVDARIRTALAELEGHEALMRTAVATGASRSEVAAALNAAVGPWPSTTPEARIPSVVDPAPTPTPERVVVRTSRPRVGALVVAGLLTFVALAGLTLALVLSRPGVPQDAEDDAAAPVSATPAARAIDPPVGVEPARSEGAATERPATATPGAGAAGAPARAKRPAKPAKPPTTAPPPPSPGPTQLEESAVLYERAHVARKKLQAIDAELAKRLLPTINELGPDGDPKKLAAVLRQIEERLETKR